MAKVSDYERVVGKFDDCRGTLAYLYESMTGNDPIPPEEYKGEWHAWLIDEVNKIAEEHRKK